MEQTKKGGHRLLVVDDNTDAATTLARLLQLLGYEAQACYSGLEALALVQSEPFEVVVMDLAMPVMDGYQTCRQLRQLPRGRDLTLIALSGHTLPEHRRLSREAGFDHHLSKPLDVAKLRELLAGYG